MTPREWNMIIEADPNLSAQADEIARRLLPWLCEIAWVQLFRTEKIANSKTAQNIAEIRAAIRWLLEEADSAWWLRERDTTPELLLDLARIQAQLAVGDTDA